MLDPTNVNWYVLLMSSRIQLQTILKWHQLVGVDESIATEPINRFTKAELKKAPDTYAAPEIPVQTESSTTPNERPIPSVPSKTIATTQSSDEAIKTAVDLATSAKSIAELRTALETFDGCALRKTATNLVFVDGNEDADILFVGEGPGAEEDRQGIPFVGASGSLLDKMIGSIGLSRGDVLISNTVFWRPPGNRTPTSQEIAACMPFVEKLIEIVRPRIIVPLGGAAAKSLLGETKGIGRLRGHWFSVETPELSQPVVATPIFHPAYLLRSPIQKCAAWNDLRLIQKKLAELQ